MSFFDDDAQPQAVVNTTTYVDPRPGVCPGCGRCNTCGRGGRGGRRAQPWPYYPNYGPIYVGDIPGVTYGQVTC